MIMQALLNQALSGKTVARTPRPNIKALTEHNALRKPTPWVRSSGHRELTGRWFAFQTPRNGRVARQGKAALIVPSAWKRVGDITAGYATPLEAMRA